MSTFSCFEEKNKKYVTAQHCEDVCLLSLVLCTRDRGNTRALLSIIVFA
uniref:Uncharacterized protein n=1 Tax=Anguilla anguilla TaxID=7936 RepID=A0A0E9R2V1_ANGAN